MKTELPYLSYNVSSSPSFSVLSIKQEMRNKKKEEEEGEETKKAGPAAKKGKSGCV
jgi:hypothetical protein